MFDNDTAQICEGGHLINRAYTCLPEYNRAYCITCGAKTVIECSECSSPIKGSIKLAGLNQVFNDSYTIPNYCDACGKPYPWMKAKQLAAFELVDLSDTLDEDDKTQLKLSIGELVRDTPKTSVAVIRFQKYAIKAGTAIATSLKELMVDIVSEAVKKAIWSSQ